MERNHENHHRFSSFSKLSLESREWSERIFGRVPKKGVTAIVATVLLLMMTVAAAGLAYKWIMNTQNSIQINAQDDLNKNQARTGAKLNIDSMWNDAGKISFILRNTGSYAFADVSKFSLYANGVPVTTIPTYNPDGGLSPGGVTTVNTQENFVTVGNPKTIKIVTDLGTEVPYKCDIPSSSQTWC
ncbi:Uncharacterised protein [uncultured archaeon]|nr:Uncharacterised protein [uncultured archaeon]